MRTVRHRDRHSVTAVITWMSSSSAFAGIDQPWNEPLDVSPGDSAFLGWAIVMLVGQFALFAWAPRLFLGGLALFFIGTTVYRWFGGMAAVVACIATCVWWLLPSREAKKRLESRKNPSPKPEKAPESSAKQVCTQPQRDAPPAHHTAPARCSKPTEQISDTRRIANLRARIDNETKPSWVKLSSSCACGHALKIKPGFKGVARCDNCGRLTRIGLDR